MRGILVEGPGFFEDLVIEHCVVGSTHGIWSVRIGNTQHVAEWFVPVAGNKIHRLAGQEVRGEGVLVCTCDGITRLAILTGLDSWSLRGVFKLFPVPPVEHVAIILEPEFPLGGPLGFSLSVKVPLSAVAS